MSRSGDQLKGSLAQLAITSNSGSSSDPSPGAAITTATTTAATVIARTTTAVVTASPLTASPLTSPHHHLQQMQQQYDMLANVPATASTTCSTFHSMKYRNLGKSGIKVPLLGLAVWTAFGNRIPETGAEDLISMAYDHGVNLFDTGDGFANGRCEAVLGCVLRKKNWKRSSFLVSCKLFWTTGPSAFLPAPSLSRKFIVEAVQASLSRLQLSYIDIVMINKLDGMCPMEEIVRAMQHLLDRGLVHYWGTSRWSPVHIMEAFTVARQFNLTPPSLEQMEYHMFTRDKMELFMPELYHKLGVGVVSWSPHSVSNDDGIQLISRRAISQEERTVRAAKQLDLNSLALRLGCDSVQLSIAWSLRNEQSNCVLIAPRSTDQLYLHLNALKILTKLTPAHMEEIELILNNKPIVKRRGASFSDRSAIIASAAAATATSPGASIAGPATAVALSAETAAATTTTAAVSAATAAAVASGAPVPV